MLMSKSVAELNWGILFQEISDLLRQPNSPRSQVTFHSHCIKMQGQTSKRCHTFLPG